MLHFGVVTENKLLCTDSETGVSALSGQQQTSGPSRKLPQLSKQDRQLSRKPAAQSDQQPQTTLSDVQPAQSAGQLSGQQQTGTKRQFGQPSGQLGEQTAEQLTNQSASQSVQKQQQSQQIQGGRKEADSDVGSSDVGIKPVAKESENETEKNTESAGSERAEDKAVGQVDDTEKTASMKGKQPVRESKDTDAEDKDDHSERQSQAKNEVFMSRVMNKNA